MGRRDHPLIIFKFPYFTIYLLMTEAFLHFLLRFQKFYEKNLRTSDSKLLQVLDPGTANLGAGPDFSSAKIFMEGLHWNGAVELHLLSSDWFRHGHQKDSNYDGSYFMWFGKTILMFVIQMEILYLPFSQAIL